MIRRLSLALAGAILIALHAAFPAKAAQPVNCLPTSNLPGLTAVNSINSMFSATWSSSSGSSRPTDPCTGVTPVGMVWLDVSASPLNKWKYYDGNSDIVIGTFDGATHQFKPPVGGGVNTLASATTADLGSVPEAVLTVSGTTTISGFGSTAPTGTIKFLTFSGVLQLTYDGTKLILPTAANVTTAAGDQLAAVALGSGNWRIIAYTRADGTSLSTNANIIGAFNLTGNITPSALGAGPTNNWAPTGLSTASQVFASTSANGTVTGLLAGAPGQRVTIYNIGSFNLTLNAQDASSSAANRFLLSATQTLRPSQSLTFVYDNVSAIKGWRPEAMIVAQPTAAAFKNLKVGNDSGAPTTTMGITADQLIVEDASGQAYRLQNVNVAPVMTASGVNGLDAGSIVNNVITWYSANVIYNPTTGAVAGLYSTQATCSAATLPSGYTACARVGWVRTDGAATARWMRTQQYGRRTNYVVVAATNTANLPILTGTGAIGSTTVPTWVAFSVSNFVPPTASTIAISATVQGNPASAMVAPNNSYGAVGSTANSPPIVAAVGSASSPAATPGDIILESTSIYAAATAGFVVVRGWEDNL